MCSSTSYLLLRRHYVPASHNTILTGFLQGGVSVVFTISSITKVLDIAQFKQTIRTFHLLPEWLSGIAAILFLCGEFAVVVLVVLGGSLLAFGFALAVGLLLLFCLALVLVLIRKIRTACNCFGSNAKQVSRMDVWRNIGFILCALTGYGTLIWTKSIQGNMGLLEWLLIGFGAIIFVVFWTQLGEIAQLFR